MSHQKLDLAAILHERGYRLTPQRQMVLDALCQAAGHATPEQVYELVRLRSEAVNRATVYRTLKFLQELRVVAATSLPDGHLEYEIAQLEPHHHLVCVKCQANLEISDKVFSRFVGSVRDEHGFQVDTTHVTLHGHCAVCHPQE